MGLAGAAVAEREEKCFYLASVAHAKVVWVLRLPRTHPRDRLCFAFQNHGRREFAPLGWLRRGSAVRSAKGLFDASEF